MLSEQQKRDFCAIMLHKYGVSIDMNNELLPIFFVAYKSAVISENTSKQTSEHIQKIIADFEKNTAAKINKMEIRQFRFHNAREAFWFAFGKYGLAVIIISALLFSGWWIYRKEEGEKQKAMYLSAFMESVHLQQRSLDRRKTAHVITLFPVKTVKEAEAGKNYVYSEACKCIEVPLYYETVK